MFQKTVLRDSAVGERWDNKVKLDVSMLLTPTLSFLVVTELYSFTYIHRIRTSVLAVLVIENSCRFRSQNSETVDFD